MRIDACKIRWRRCNIESGRSLWRHQKRLASEMGGHAVVSEEWSLIGMTVTRSFTFSLPFKLWRLRHTANEL